MTPSTIQRWTVTCCPECNLRKSQLEGYALPRLSISTDAENPAAKGIWDRALRGLQFQHARGGDDRQHRLRSFLSLMKDIVPPEQVHASFPAASAGESGLKIDWTKIDSLMELFARGCHCYIERRPLPANARVHCYSDLAGKPAPDIAVEVLAEARVRELGPGITMRRAYVRDETQEAALYAFEFWGLPAFLVMAFAPAPRPVPRRSDVELALKEVCSGGARSAEARGLKKGRESMTPVYRFKMYNISTDAEQESRRWATRETIEKVGGNVIEDSVINVDEALLGREIPGMTDRGFKP
jgi:hypothetical protein